MVDSRILFASAIGVVGLERIAEAVVSRRHAAWAFARGGVERGRAHHPVMVALHVAFLAGCAAEPWLADRPFVPWLGWPALGLALGCQAVRWWCVAALGPRWNIRIITVPGDLDMNLSTFQ